MSRLPAALVLLVAVTACTDSGDGTKELRVTITEPSRGQVTIAVPASVPAGVVRVTVRNDAVAPHEALLVRVDGDHTGDEVVDVLRGYGSPVPPWLHREGGVSTTRPGTSHAATVLLPPGSYHVVDLDAGRAVALTVTASASASERALPARRATITARDHEFQARNLKEGTHEVRFENAGREPHDVAAIPIVGDRTLDEVRRFLADPTSTRVLDFEAGTEAQAIDGGKALVTRMTFQKGRYALICALSDRAGGPPHYALGMVQEVTVA